MNSHFRFLCLCLAMLCVGGASRAQLTGTKTVPSTSYPTLKVAVDSLNQYGVGTGGVIINFTASTNETAPVGGYLLGSATLNASTSATNKVTINGNGNLITGYVGTSTTADGIFYIMGTDYVSINNLNLVDPAANTTSTTQMEWGYSLVKLSGTAPFDGCQYVTINGCTITLNKTYTNTIGIRAAHSIAATTSILTTTGTTAASTNSYNNFTGNTITGVTRGISLIGISSGAAVYDKKNVIGGTSTSQGNTITAGGATNTSYNVWTQYDSVITISYNSFYVNPTQGNTAVYEVYTSTGNGDLTVTNNLFDVNCNMTSASMYAYWNSSAHTDPGNNLNAASTHNISNNTITGNNPVATSSYLYGLYESSAYSKNCIMSNNNIRDINWNISTGYLYLLYQYLTYSPNVVVDNNTIYNIQQRQPSTSGYIYGFYLYNYATPTGKLSMQNNVVRKIKSNYFIYAYYNYASYTAPPAGYTGQIVKANNNITDSLDLTTASTGYCYNYWCYNGFDSTEVNYNRVTNIQGSLTGYTYIYNYTYGYYAPYKYTVKGNYVNNINTFNIGIYNQFGYYASFCDSNIVSNITSTGTAGYIYNYLGLYGTDYISSNNRVDRITTSGAYMYNYLGYYGTNATIRNNALTNISLGGANGYMYNYFGYNISNGGDLHHNRIDSVSQGTYSSYFYPMYAYHTGGGILKIHDNIFSNLSTQSTGITTFYPYYLYTTSATAQIDFYNNFLTNINYPAGYNTSANAAIYMPQPGIFNLYNNTIRVNATNTGASFGYTGILYVPTAIMDLRNNIINVNVVPGSTGFTAALRRTTGAAGTSPSNYMGTSNGNIFYTPSATGSWLYCEGGSPTGMVNAYNLASDPNFNTPCGLFKSFMGHDQASFTENNLIPATFTGSYVPTGSSYAEKGAVPTGAPLVVTDFMGITRGAVADIGALEFTGTSLDNAPPIISYTPVPVKSYCSSAPTLLATITDNSGVNNTTGTAPRLYYKKSSESNAFSSTNNTNTFNGWKYVEATSVSGSAYTFNFDYSKLTSSVGPGDSITYFIIAQDNATIVNAGASVMGFPVCPSSVALSSTHGPTNNSPVANGFKILSTPVFKALGFPGSACGSGSSVISITPTPVGAAVQWQTSTLTGTFSNITGATNSSYTTPVNTTTLLYRAVITCGTSVLTTTATDTFVIANPSIISTTGATRCGYGALTLSVTGSPFTTGKWYNTATGGTSFFSGNSYTTPNINSSVTYYVSGNTPNASTEIVSMNPEVAYTYGGLSGSGLWIRFRNAATNFYSTTVYPYSGSGTFEVELLDSVGNSTGYKAGPFTTTGGSGTTPVVLPLGWNNIKPGRYQLLMVNHTGTPYLNMEYMPRTTPAANFPFNSPSGNATIEEGIYSGVAYYYCFFYNNIIGADCESSAPRKAVTATITPAPPITVSSPGFPGICLGTSTSVNVTSPNSSYVYTWMPGSLSGSSFTVSPTTSTTYAVTATDPYTGCVNFDTVRIFVNPVPTPPTIAPKNPKICEGSSVILVGSAPPGSAGTQTLGTGSVAMSLPGPFYGTYTGNHSQYLIKSAELVAAGVRPGLLTSLAFQSSGTGYTLNNFEIKLANVSMAALPSAITCATGMVSVYTQATLVPPSSGWNTFVFNGSSFTWSGGDLLVDVSNMNCPNCPAVACSSWGSSATVLGTTQSYQASYHVYNDNNCGIIACPPTGSYNTASSTARPNMQLGYREPSALNWLNVTGLYKNSGLTNTVSLIDTNTVVYASPTTTTVYRAVTNAQGCISGPSLPDTVFVDPAPVVLIAPAGPQTICSGQPVTLCIPTGLNQSYQWFLNNVAIAGANTNCYVAGAAGSYKVTATNIITGCSATSIPTVLTVNALPTITATAGGSTTICNGSSVTLTANSPTAIAWQWQESGVSIAGATSSTYTATTTGNYTVVVTNSFSCSNTSNVVAVIVNTTPSTVTPQGSTSFCTGGGVVLQAPTGTSYTYQWYNGAGIIGGATSSSYTATTTGNYYVIVTNTVTGCSSTSTPTSVTVGAGPNATINPQGTIGGCQGGTVLLTAISQPGLCYQWNLNGSPITGATNNTYTASLNGSYTVTVSICATSCVSTTVTPTVITLNPPPPASVTPTNPVPFCQGGSTTLSANTGTGLSYQWYNGTTAITGATSATHSAVANGSYTVVVTNTSTGCTQTSNIVPVTVYAAPNAAITPATNPTFCQGGSVVLNAATTGITSYRWNLNGTPITGAPGAGTSYTASSTGLYSVTVTNSNGCTATSPATSVQVNALPNVTTIPTGNAAVCQGYTTVLSAPGGPSLSYQWYNGATAITGATSNTYTTGTAGTYTVKITNAVTGCFATSNNIVLSVNTPPPAVMSSTGTTTICQDDSVKLSANTGTGYLYQWKLNGNDIVGLDPTSAVYYAKVAGRYTVSVSNATNCTTLSNSIVITVNPRPAAYITYNTPLEFCEGSAVVLVANPGTGLTYQWYMDGTPLTNTSNNNVSAVSGLYSLKVTNTFGCVTNSDALNVTVYPTPVPTIVRTNSTLQTSQPYSSYQWFFNNNAIGGATSDSYVFNANGAYKVRVVDANGCEGFSNQFFVNNVGIAQTAAGKSIHVYPNPTSGIVHIEATVKVKVVLRDVTGKSVLEEKDVKEINLGDVANGMYLLYISDLDGQLLRVEKLKKTDK